MKKLIMFLSGFVLMVLMFLALCAAGAIYDAGRDLVVEPYFFQTNNLSSMRAGVPASPDDLGAGRVRDMLIKKYIMEYFYVVPDVENIAQRMLKSGTIALMSSPAAFDNWRQTQAEIIQSMAENKALRIVFVDDEMYKPDGSDYWIVSYKLLTWDTPNDFSVPPFVTTGRIFLQIRYEPGLRPDSDQMTVAQYLEEGGDPAAVFKFRVDDVVVQ